MLNAATAVKDGGSVLPLKIAVIDARKSTLEPEPAKGKK